VYKKLTVGGISSDIEKAFSCINHDVLLSEMQFYDISGKQKTLYKYYLNNRYQRVSIKNNKYKSTKLSKWSEIKHGMPQGWVPCYFCSMYIYK